MMTIVAGISLIVGGIGVMNIMLVAVAERTHEIGIRKAVGASNLNIFLQFLFESLILCGLGGIIGLAFGYILAFLLSTVTPFGPYIDLIIIGASILVPIIVGTIFGMYPAIKASLRNPIDSLKSN
jgi:ABC-type antimicrobial peptide transport system permease subunit